MKLLVEAVDKGRGMTMNELEQAVVKAKVLGLNRLVKTQVGFKGQIRTIEFGEGISVEAPSAD